ncbi:relaxase/mobilization nuclease domain-containing protein [Sphingobium yanoikuyae]|uniref:relaxase/mobilization nuclease domain-containing protein n=1 Tax=Sphingobium yanoikuyae TaxID=13690 RepID=UPI0008479E55|nr:relaxase/mobilization nuclease domain-containing protein [Sphingobium yanoikuyae]MDG2511067.1 relaxase/mobilization nuclease domain-containing protein [Sphingobium yanoikuyae]
MIPEIKFGRDFGGLVNYLIDQRDHEVLDIRGVSSIDMAAQEMALVASMARRAKSVVMHCSLSAAIEDGQLAATDWRQIVDEIDSEFDLRNHQRVIVRHKDKDYDHVHIFWCTVNPDTGQTPPKQLFLAKGVKVAGLGDFALTPKQAASLAKDQTVRGSFNRHALYRLQNFCRRFERKLGLRRLRTPREMAADRMSRQSRGPSGSQTHRAERTGSPLLLERAPAIRSALDEPDWPRAQRRLAAIGIGLRPAFRSSKTNGDKVVGLILFDLTDPQNSIKASQLDGDGRRYGLVQIEKRRKSGTPTLGEWWPTAAATVPAPESATDIDETSIRDDFEAYRARCLHQRREASVRRKQLKEQYAKDRKAVAKALMEKRRQQAQSLAASARRAFYAYFSTHVRGPRMAKLDGELRNALRALRLPRVMQWHEFIAQRPMASQSVTDRNVASQTNASLRIDRPIAKSPRLAQSDQKGSSNVKPMDRVEPVPAEANDLEWLIALQRQRSGPGR